MELEIINKIIIEYGWNAFLLILMIGIYFKKINPENEKKINEFKKEIKEQQEQIEGQYLKSITELKDKMDEDRKQCISRLDEKDKLFIGELKNVTSASKNDTDLLAKELNEQWKLIIDLTHKIDLYFKK